MFTKYLNRLILLVIMVLFAVTCGAAPLTTKVDVTGGKIEGIRQDGIFIYKGIPFAAPPVGNLRWKSPQPVLPWKGVKKTDKFAPGPMQDIEFAKILGGPQDMSEDCLYLNVWTGAQKTEEKRPVMLWIYGGGFGVGMTSTPVYDGANLAKKGVVLVSVAYRVGPMGFLAHPELTAESGHGSGAYGIQDQIAGLRWIKDNIARFGGDPSNVTIFGDSAGGYSVCMLSSSPMAKGLFQRAISESGGGLRPERMPLEQAEEMGKKYLENLGAKTIAEARALSAEEIQKNTKGMGSFKPVADDVTVMKNQYEAFDSSSFNDTPILVGTNSNEGGLFVNQKLNKETFEAIVKGLYAPAAEEILKAYPHANDEEATQSSKDLMRESSFAWPTWIWAVMQTRNGKNKAYVYYYDHRVEGVPGGANHAAELSYVFGNLGGSGKPVTEEDRALSDLIDTYWINFAKTGDPNGEGLPKWPAFDEKKNLVMYIDSNTGARKHPDLDKIMAFDKYYARMREASDKK